MTKDLSFYRYSQKIVRRKCPVLAAFTPQGQAVLVHCGLWTCPRCSKMNARRWAKLVRTHLSNKKGEWWFITLTFGSEYKQPSKAFAILPRLWDALRKEMQRTYKDWEFMAFVEGQAKTRGGMPHFHIISNHHVPSTKGLRGQWTKKGVHDWAIKRGFGFEASCTEANSDKAGDYVSKYASKGDPNMPRKFRRVRASRTWTRKEKNPEKRLLVPAKGESLIHYLLRVQDTTDCEIETLYKRWREAQDELDKQTAKTD